MSANYGGPGGSGAPAAVGGSAGGAAGAGPPPGVDPQQYYMQRQRMLMAQQQQQQQMAAAGGRPMQMMYGQQQQQQHAMHMSHMQQAGGSYGSPGQYYGAPHSAASGVPSTQAPGAPTSMSGAAAAGGGQRSAAGGGVAGAPPMVGAFGARGIQLPPDVHQRIQSEPDHQKRRQMLADYIRQNNIQVPNMQLQRHPNAGGQPGGYPPPGMAGGAGAAGGGATATPGSATGNSMPMDSAAMMHSRMVAGGGSGMYPSAGGGGAAAAAGAGTGGGPGPQGASSQGMHQHSQMLLGAPTGGSNVARPIKQSLSPQMGGACQGGGGASGVPSSTANSNVVTSSGPALTSMPQSASANASYRSYPGMPGGYPPGYGGPPVHSMASLQPAIAARETGQQKGGRGGTKATGRARNTKAAGANRAAAGVSAAAAAAAPVLSPAPNQMMEEEEKQRRFLVQQQLQQQQQRFMDGRVGGASGGNQRSPPPPGSSYNSFPIHQGMTVTSSASGGGGAGMLPGSGSGMMASMSQAQQQQQQFGAHMSMMSHQQQMQMHQQQQAQAQHAAMQQQQQQGAPGSMMGASPQQQHQQAALAHHMQQQQQLHQQQQQHLMQQQQLHQQPMTPGGSGPLPGAGPAQGVSNAPGMPSVPAQTARSIQDMKAQAAAAAAAAQDAAAAEAAEQAEYDALLEEFRKQYTEKLKRYADRIKQDGMPLPSAFERIMEVLNGMRRVTKELLARMLRTIVPKMLEKASLTFPVMEALRLWCEEDAASSGGKEAKTEGGEEATPLAESSPGERAKEAGEAKGPRRAKVFPDPIPVELRMMRIMAPDSMARISRSARLDDKLVSRRKRFADATAIEDGPVWNPRRLKYELEETREIFDDEPKGKTPEAVNGINPASPAELALNRHSPQAAAIITTHSSTLSASAARQPTVNSVVAAPIPRPIIEVECMFKRKDAWKFSQEASQELSNMRWSVDYDDAPISADSPDVVICMDASIVLCPKLRVLVPARYPQDQATVLFERSFPPGATEFYDELSAQIDRRLALSSQPGRLTSIWQAYLDSCDAVTSSSAVGVASIGSAPHMRPITLRPPPSFIPVDQKQRMAV